MCGIAGYVNAGSDDLTGRLQAAVAALRHRGPDDAGTAVIPTSRASVGLGATRLAIVDLSAAGHMPMWDADGTCALVYNGEIYNAPHLRTELEARGVHFRSRTDTEVLLYGLMLDGPEFLDALDGMYAFAFWDGRDEGSLLLARDRFGEKPMFVSEISDGSVIFGSETSVMTTLLGRTPDIDLSALRHVVEWKYPPPDRSVFCGVRKVLPGTWERHAVGVSVRTGRLRELSSNAAIDSARTTRAAAALLGDALRESIASRLIADVPVGVFLSGGLDSAAVAAIAARALPAGERLNTYTVGYPGTSESELEPAKKVAEQLGARHHEIRLGDDDLAALPFVASALGEPVGDPAALPTYFLSLMARTSSTVLLTGEGSDELLFGYPRYLLHDLADDAQRGSLAARALSLLPTRPSARIRSASADAAQRERAWKGVPVDEFGLFDTPAENVVAHDGAAPMRNADAARADDVARWMPEDVLTRVDRMTMAASIEARAPFLAKEIARLGLNLPARTLRRFPYGKLALREALAPYYGLRKRWGPKRPFAVPLAGWLAGPLRPLVEDAFFGYRLAARGWFRTDGLRRVGAAALRGEACSSAWTLLIIELWARAHVDGEAPPGGHQPLDCHISEKQAAGAAISNLIVTTNFPPTVGGIQRCARELWGHGGFGRVAVIAPQTAGGDRAYDAHFPGTVHRVRAGRGLRNRLRFIGALSLQLSYCLPKAQTVHLFNVLTAPSVLPFLPFRRRPMVIWAHALEVTHPKLQPLIRLFLRRADRVVVPSEFTRGLVLQRGAKPNAIVKINWGGDDLRRMYPHTDAGAFRKEWGIAHDAFLILSVSRLDPLNRYKGLDRAIEVAAHLRRTQANFRWIIVGGGSDLEFYRARVAQAGVDAHVSFVGACDDAALANAYSACDLFCLLSREEMSSRGLLAEGYGIVFLEAASFAKPAIALRRGGVPDAVIGGQTGVLVDEDDAETIAAAIARLIDEPAELQRLGENAFERAMGPASWSAARRQLSDMLLTLDGRLNRPD